MDAKRKRELTLGVIAVVLVAIAAASLLRSSFYRSPSNARANTTAATSAQTRAKSPLTEVDLKALEAERPEPEDGTRNPFRFKPKLPPPPSPAVIKQQQQQKAAAEQAAKLPVEPPPPPRIPLKYIGDMADPKNPGKKIAILSDARSSYWGREGDVIEGRYLIVRIGVESIELAYLDGRGRQTIRQTGQ